MSEADFKVMRRADAPDYTGGKAGPFLGYARPLGSEQLALNVRVLPPGATNAPPGVPESWGHNHKTIEEIYYVLADELAVRLRSDEVVLGEHDAVLIAPDTPRGVRNRTDRDAQLLMVSARVADAMAESVPHDDVWSG